MGRPTLLVWGEEDPILPVSQALAAARAAPRVRLMTMPATRHTPHLDDPEGFSRLIQWFLSEPLDAAAERLWSDVLSERCAIPADGAGNGAVAKVPTAVAVPGT